MLHDSRIANLTDDQRTKLRRLVWAAVSKGVVAAFVAVGTELGKRLVERVVGDDDEDEEEETPE